MTRYVPYENCLRKESGRRTPNGAEAGERSIQSLTNPTIPRPISGKRLAPGSNPEASLLSSGIRQTESVRPSHKKCKPKAAARSTTAWFPAAGPLPDFSLPESPLPWDSPPRCGISINRPARLPGGNLRTQGNFPASAAARTRNTGPQESY